MRSQWRLLLVVTSILAFRLSIKAVLVFFVVVQNARRRRELSISPLSLRIRLRANSPLPPSGRPFTGLRRVMLRAHKQAWCWQDEWHDLTISDIRRLEKETQLALQQKFGVPVNDKTMENNDVADQVRFLCGSERIFSNSGMFFPSHIAGAEGWRWKAARSHVALLVLSRHQKITFRRHQTIIDTCNVIKIL